MAILTFILNIIRHSSSIGECLFYFGKIIIFSDVVFYQHPPFIRFKFVPEFRMPSVRWQRSLT